MAESTMVSLWGTAIISWERTLEGSRTLWEAFKLAVEGIERPAEPVDELGDDKLREAQGFLVRRYINAMHREILEWNGAKKEKGSETADLGLRTGLKGMQSSRNKKKATEVPLAPSVIPPPASTSTISHPTTSTTTTSCPSTTTTTSSSPTSTSSTPTSDNVPL